MVAMLQFAHIDMNGNEIQNVLAQNLASAPSANVAAGRFYFNTADHTLYVYNGTAWVDALNQGKIYTFQNGLEELTGADAGKVQIKLATGDNAGNITLTAGANGLAASVAEASTSAKGIIEIATDSEASTGTSEVLAVNPKQLAAAVNGLIKLTDLSIASTSTNYLTYDNTTGQFGAKVSATPAASGTDLITTGGVYSNTVSAVAAHTTDANKIVVTKAGSDTTITINDVAHATKADQDGNGDNIAETYATKAEIADFIELTDLSIASASANYLTYNSATGEFGAKVDTTVTQSSTNLVTSGAVEAAISSAIVGGVTYKGTWDITSATDYSGITLPVKKGYLYYVAGTGPKTIGGIEWNAGDYLLVNEDVAAGGSLTGKVEKIDNTESADIVRTAATQTLTNKTIDADDNTIIDLATANFKSGVIVTTVAAAATAADTSIPTEKAVRTLVDGAVDGMVTLNGTQTLTNKTIDGDDNTIQDLGIGVFKSGVVVNSTTGIAAPSSASDSKIATEKAISTKLATKVEKLVAQNTALTSTGGVCTWTIANTLASADVQVAVYQVSTGAQVGAYVEAGASNIVIKFNSASDIAADTFKAVILGL